LDCYRTAYINLHYVCRHVFLLAIVAIVTKKSKPLKEWAYAGLFFDALLALSAHLMVNDGGQITAIVALIAIVVSRFMDNKI